MQYEVLEYLFEHLYEKVSEQELGDHLKKTRKLQKTGDPVKGAINAAIKELQRLPERDFEITKIQESDAANKIIRYIRLNYNRFDSVIGFQEYREYLEDLLEGEADLVMRLEVAHVRPEGPIFPGFGDIRLPTEKIEAVLCLTAGKLVTSPSWNIRYVPDSPAGANMLLLYENEDQNDPFLAFLCDDSHEVQEKRRFVIYRGQQRRGQLAFLDRLWRDSFARALTHEQAENLKVWAKNLCKDTPIDWETVFLGEAVRKCIIIE